MKNSDINCKVDLKDSNAENLCRIEYSFRLNNNLNSTTELDDSKPNVPST